MLLHRPPTRCTTQLWLFHHKIRWELPPRERRDTMLVRKCRMFNTRKVVMCLALVIITLLSDSVAIGAQRSKDKWKPVSTVVTLESTNAKFELGTIKQECTLAEKGTTPAGAGGEFPDGEVTKVTPKITCLLTEIAQKAGWEFIPLSIVCPLVGNDEDCIELEIPKEGLVIKEVGCELKFAPNEIFKTKTAGNYKERSEELEFRNVKIPVAKTGAGCPAGTEVEFNALFKVTPALIDDENLAGPRWHRRPIGSKGSGESIEPKAPENLKGEGGTQTLNGEIGGTSIEITSKDLQVKTAIFNGVLQGQIKQELVYDQPTIVKPALKGCAVTIGEKNIVQVKGHLMWKWNGEAPDVVFTASEPASQSEVVNGVLTTVALKGTSCGILAGTFTIAGSEAALPSPAHEEEWSKTLALSVVQQESVQQHFWTGETFKNLKVGLLLAGHSASSAGQVVLNPLQQELAIFEN